MAKIFLSYHRRSQPVAESLVQDLEAMGHQVWYDQELSGGQVWWNRILASIRDCEVFVFVLDPHSLDSTACKREYGYAADLGKAVLPVLTTDGVSINLLPPVLSQVQLVDIRSGDRAAVLRLARALTTLPPPVPLPDPLPETPTVPLSYLGTLTEQVDKSSSLTYEEQSALIVDLRANARDTETRSDALTLIRRLRKRRDLFASIADEIDEVLRGEMPPLTSSVVSSGPVSTPPPDVGPFVPAPTPALQSIAMPASIPTPSPQPAIEVAPRAWPTSDSSLLARLQMAAIGFAAGAMLLAISVMVAATDSTRNNDGALLILGYGGSVWAVAGAIAAKRRPAIKATLALAAAGLLLVWAFTAAVGETEAFLVAMVFGGSGGAFVGAVFGEIRSRMKKASGVPSYS